MKQESNKLADVIRGAMQCDGRTVYAVARDAGLVVSIVQRFDAGGDVTLQTASALCDTLGLQLQPVRKGR